MKVIYEVEVLGLGSKIQQCRRLSGKSVEELADAVGISRQTWYAIENEQHSVHVDVIRQIEAQLRESAIALSILPLFGVDIKESSRDV